MEITYRRGRPQAAYLYLARRPGDIAVRTLVTPDGLVIDFASDGRAMGIEIPSPASGTLDAVNAALALAKQPPMRREDLAPLLAA